MIMCYNFYDIFFRFNFLSDLRYKKITQKRRNKGAKQMRKLFGGISMGWGKIIIFSLAAAVYTAVVNLIPAFKGTSFQDIAVNLEAWILFAMFIIMNCETRKEAVCKTFIFFLISQPLIYLIEALAGPMGFEIFSYYKYWFIITLLTIPGATIAFQVKKKGWSGALVLSIAIAFLGYTAVTYYRNLRFDFPHHLLSMIFCILLAITMIILFIDDLKPRIVAAVILAAAISISLFITKPVLTYDISLPDGNWSYKVEDDSIAKLDKNGKCSFTVRAEKKGVTLITFTNKKGEKKEYYVTVSSGGIYMNEFE